MALVAQMKIKLYKMTLTWDVDTDTFETPANNPFMTHIRNRKRLSDSIAANIIVDYIAA